MQVDRPAPRREGVEFAQRAGEGLAVGRHVLHGHRSALGLDPSPRGLGAEEGVVAQGPGLVAGGGEVQEGVDAGVQEGADRGGGVALGPAARVAAREDLAR